MRLLSGVLACALISYACTPDFATESEADVILRISKILGLAGEDEDEGDVLFSDVTPIFNDNARITFQNIPKNANGPLLGQFNDVFMERYEVVYFRTDGRNVEGVDVPYRFTGGMATLVPAGGEAEAVIMVVRHQAKEEPPLRNLAFLPQVNVNNGAGGGQGIITVIAEITFHGRTTNNRAVTTSGRLTISFADFADPTTTSPTPVPTQSASASPAPLGPSPSPSSRP
jgi:hypothetical protein